jgi:hypothetical protein
MKIPTQSTKSFCTLFGVGGSVPYPSAPAIR